jgi:hypothetical protein
MELWHSSRKIFESFRPLPREDVVDHMRKLTMQWLGGVDFSSPNATKRSIRGQGVCRQGQPKTFTRAHVASIRHARTCVEIQFAAPKGCQRDQAMHMLGPGALIQCNDPRRLIGGHPAFSQLSRKFSYPVLRRESKPVGQ